MRYHHLVSRQRNPISHHVTSLVAWLNAATRVEAMLRVQNESWLVARKAAVLTNPLE